MPNNSPSISTRHLTTLAEKSTILVPYKGKLPDLPGGRAASMAYPSCSVIITTCDRPGELRRSIASVVGQTVRPQELIVVDDCSSHPNQSAVAEHHSSGLRILYHRLTQRSGASAARNAGASLASGEILMFLDDDDAWEPRKVEAQLSLFATNPEAAAVYTGMLAMATRMAARCSTRLAITCQARRGPRFYFATLSAPHRPWQCALKSSMIWVALIRSCPRCRIMISG